MDYSGHTGFSAVLAISLFTWNHRFGSAMLLLFGAYVALMLHQRYHTLLDVLATLVVIAPLTLATHKNIALISRRFQQGTPGAPRPQ
jgi:hypothetical protein